MHVPWAQWLAGAWVLVALAVAAIPAWSQVSSRGAQTKAVAQAKQIALALKLFAGDNDGKYPRDGVPLGLNAPATSNAAFACLFPTYLQNETIFGNALSAYQTRAPDNVIDDPYTGKPIKTLEPGENVYAYVMGLDETFNQDCPVVVDGTDGTGHYVTDAARRGGLWGGTEAVVIRLDTSGTMEPLLGPADARYIPLGALAAAFGGKPEDNLLDVTHFGGVRLLEPAVDPGKRP